MSVKKIIDDYLCELNRSRESIMRKLDLMQHEDSSKKRELENLLIFIDNEIRDYKSE